MRGIGKGQNIHLFIIPEVIQLMRRELYDAGITTSRQEQQAGCIYQDAETLVNVTAWLVINSMRTERVQFNALCLQVFVIMNCLSVADSLCLRCRTQRTCGGRMLSKCYWMHAATLRSRASQIPG